MKLQITRYLPTKAVAAMLFSCVLTDGTAVADSINIDFGDSTFTPYGLISPSSAFGAASGQVGVWNNVNLLNTPSPIRDTSGRLTDAAITVTAISGTMQGFSDFGCFPSCLSTPPGGSIDAWKLMMKNFFGLGWRIDITDLLDGIYDVYLYEPNNGAIGTGSGSANGVGFSNINGSFESGTFIEGINYTLLQGVSVTGGSFIASVELNLSGLSGIQLVPTAGEPNPVPEPTSLLLFGTGLLGLALRGLKRRRSVDSSANGKTQ